MSPFYYGYIKLLQKFIKIQVFALGLFPIFEFSQTEFILLFLTSIFAIAFNQQNRILNAIPFCLEIGSDKIVKDSCYLFFKAVPPFDMIVLSPKHDGQQSFFS